MNKKVELVKAVMLLPGTVLLGIPGIILYATRPVFFLVLLSDLQLMAETVTEPRGYV